MLTDCGHVIVVDDDPSLRQMVMRYLEDHNVPTKSKQNISGVMTYWPFGFRWSDASFARKLLSAERGTLSFPVPKPFISALCPFRQLPLCRF